MLQETEIFCDASIEDERSGGVSIMAAVCPKTGKAFTEVNHSFPTAIAEALAVRIAFNSFKNAQVIYTDALDVVNMYKSSSGKTYYENSQHVSCMLAPLERCGVSVRKINRSKNGFPHNVANWVRTNADLREDFGKIVQWKVEFDSKSSIKSIQRITPKPELRMVESVKKEQNFLAETFLKLIIREGQIQRRLWDIHNEKTSLMEEYEYLKSAFRSSSEFLSIALFENSEHVIHDKSSELKTFQNTEDFIPGYNHACERVSQLTEDIPDNFLKENKLEVEIDISSALRTKFGEKECQKRDIFFYEEQDKESIKELDSVA